MLINLSHTSSLFQFEALSGPISVLLLIWYLQCVPFCPSFNYWITLFNLPFTLSLSKSVLFFPLFSHCDTSSTFPTVPANCWSLGWQPHSSPLFCSLLLVMVGRQKTGNSSFSGMGFQILCLVAAAAGFQQQQHLIRSGVWPLT